MRSRQRLSRRQITTLLLAGLMSYGISALVFWPASHAWSLVAPAFSNFVLTEPEGRIWVGTGQAKIHGIDLGRIEWRFLTGRLLNGQLAFAIGLYSPDGQGAGEGTATLHWRGFEIQHFTGNFPAATALPHPVIAAMSPGGNVMVNLDAMTLSVGGRPEHVTGQIAWKNALLDLGQLVSLGDIHVTLSTDDTGMHAAVSDGGGPLLLSGTFFLGGEGRYRFEGIVGARPVAAPELVAAVRLLGPRDDSGRHRLRFEGRL